MGIGYKDTSHKEIGFIAIEGTGNTEQCVTYLSHLSDNYSNVSIPIFVITRTIGRYFIGCNTTDNQKRCGSLT